MPDLSSIAREREVLSAVADAIVVAAVGRGLRVAVRCPESHLAFAGQLARALHARGRACRCLVSKPTPSAASLPSNHGAAESTLAVITSEPFAQTDDDVQRLNIDLTLGAAKAPEGPVSHKQIGDGDADADDEPDIVLGYHDPHGLIIRHMAPHLSRLLTSQQPA
ncbi:hypothetical protein [Micromonospora rhizosphaerae]|uniref:hypothetical protein n=1 Tax=Micromonospora rhizosphaerae TaxID=568872 RepID=UPI00114D30F0|nr:hypothetical protein [Micromonospora rhizosphaerae]